MKPTISVVFTEFAPVKIKPMPFAVRLADAKAKKKATKKKK